MKFSNLILLSVALLYSCGTSHEGHDHETEGHDHAQEARDIHNHAHEETSGTHEEEDGEIIIKPEMAEKFRITFTRVDSLPFYPTYRTGGTILPDAGAVSTAVAPSSGIVRFASGINPGTPVAAGSVIATISAANITGGDPNAVASTALAAAKKELDRITPLYKEGIVTEKDYNAKLAEYEMLKASSSGSKSGSTVKSPITGAVLSLAVNDGEYVEAGSPVATIGSSRKLVLRADLPSRKSREAANIVSAVIIDPDNGSATDIGDFGGRRIATPSGATSVSGGFMPVYFEFNNNGYVNPGQICEVVLIGNTSSDALTVPVGSVIEQMGANYVFVRLDDECYERRQVKLGASDGKRIQVTEGIAPGEDVVDGGVAFVRLTESKNIIPEGHSHNH